MGSAGEESAPKAAQADRTLEHVDSADDICMICSTNSVDLRTTLSCGCRSASFCADCLFKWLGSNNSRCPICRTAPVAVPGKSSEKCDEGARHLAVAQASQFEDKESLKKAVNCYFNAIACDRNDPQGYVGAAYIVLLLGSNKSAMRYLEAALEVAPDNKDAQKLMAYAKEQVEQGNEGQEVIHEDEQQQQCHADGDVPSKGRNRTL